MIYFEIVVIIAIVYFLLMFFFVLGDHLSFRVQYIPIDFRKKKDIL